MKKDNNNKETHFKMETTETWMKTALLTQTKCSLEQGKNMKEKHEKDDSYKCHSKFT